MPDLFGRTVNGASGGLGRLATAIGGGGQSSYDKARDSEMTLQSKLAQALSTISAHDASARLHNLQADGEQDQLARRKPEAMLDSALTTHGIPTDERGAVDEFLKTGALGGKYRPGAGDMGPVAPAPDWQDKLGAVARHLGNVNGALTLGGKNIEDVAKANAIGTAEERKGAVINGKLDPLRLSQAEFAAKGSAPFSFHEFGTGNNLTGAVDDQNGPAKRYAEYRGETTKSQKANQVQSYAAAGASSASAEASRASAENSRAHARKTGIEVEQVLSGSGKGSLTSPKDKFEAENKLRDEFQKQTQTFSKVRDAYSKLVAASQNPNAMSDIALIYAYMKQLDPDSVVREGEFATAQNAGGIPDRIVNIYNRSLNGTRLNDVQRKNILGEGKKVYDAQGAAHQQTERTYGELANRYNLDVRNIVTPYAPVQVPGQAGAGKVVDFGSLQAKPAAPAASAGRVVDFGGLK